MTKQRILGIDPGLNRTGFGVIEIEGSRLRCVDAGVIRIPTGALAQRLHVILIELGAVIRAATPTRAAIEKVFVNVNPQSTLLLGQARGAAICAAVAAGLDVTEHTALQVKQAVVGYGKADKRQVQLMVQRLLNLGRVPSTDAADALACAICAAHAGSVLYRAARAYGGADRAHAGGTADATRMSSAALLQQAAAVGLGARGRRSRSAWRALAAVSDAPAVSAKRRAA